ncbi:MAG TPA: hypothetical protein VL334_14335 [Anaerolineae bacterium]|nr:hypothetical protein [Anaerolineae bacterium]
MSPKVTLSISKELAAGLEPHRDGLNLSRIFANALERELAKQVSLPQDAQAMTDMLSRLGGEMDDADRSDFASGWIDGLKYAQTASYVQFRRCERMNSMLMFDFPPDAQQRLNSLIAAQEVFEEVIYWEGWLASMLEVWNNTYPRLVDMGIARAGLAEQYA